jgi:hypothetical protein
MISIRQLSKKRSRSRWVLSGRKRRKPEAVIEKMIVVADAKWLSEGPC